MKILYLEHLANDYGGAFLYHGLKQILGDENVIEFPCRNDYHGQPYFREGDTPGTVGGTMPLAWMPAYKTIMMWHEGDVIGELKRGAFDLVVATRRRIARHILRRLNDAVGEFSTPVVMCDHEDSVHARYDFVRWSSPPARILFKRELIQRPPYGSPNEDAILPVTIFPLPFSCPADRYPELPLRRDVLDDARRLSQQDYDSNLDYEARHEDIVCLLGYTNHNRANVYRQVHSLRGKYRIAATLGPCGDTEREWSDSEMDTGLLWHRYIRKTALAKIAISAKGAGADTVRYWEIPPTGALMFCNRRPLPTPYPFIDGEHVICYEDDASDLRDKLIYFLGHDNEREEIAAAGKAHALKYHTCEARARWFLEKCKEVM